MIVCDVMHWCVATVIFVSLENGNEEIEVFGTATRHHNSRKTVNLFILF